MGLDAHGPRPRALDCVHDGLDHFGGGALSPQVSCVHLDNEEGK